MMERKTQKDILMKRMAKLKEDQDKIKQNLQQIIETKLKEQRKEFEEQERKKRRQKARHSAYSKSRLSNYKTPPPTAPEMPRKGPAPKDCKILNQKANRRHVFVDENCTISKLACTYRTSCDKNNLQITVSAKKRTKNGAFLLANQKKLFAQ